MNQDNLDKISQLEGFKQAINEWRSTDKASQHSETLRSYINQNLQFVKKTVAETGCSKLLNISPPPATGGMVMQNVDPFDMIFNAPFGVSMMPTISDMIDQAIGIIKTNPQPNKKLEVTETIIKEYYVDPSRIRELEAISSDKFDTTKLVKMCEELNIANFNSCYMTIAMLTRTIIDHVPPLLGFKTFGEVANNYTGARSFSDSMKHLGESMRKISDSILHTIIRNKETLPTFVQVNFSRDLDVLLGEIIRIYKK